MSNRPNWMFLATLLAVSASALAAAEVVSNRGSAERNSANAQHKGAVEQKIILLDGLLLSSEKKISQDGSQEARALLARARAGFQSSQQALAAGNYTDADSLVDEAMRNLGTASRLTPNSAEIGLHDQLHYTELLQGFEAMLESYQRNVAASRSGDKVNVTEMRAIADRARALARAGRHSEAGDLLEDAQTKLVDKLNRVMGAAPIVYDLKFDTPKQEYEYTVTRYRSFESMLPMAQAKVKSDPAKRRQVEAEATAGRNLRRDADHLGTRQSYVEANRLLQKAIEHFEKAFELSGLTTDASASLKPLH